MPDFLNANKYEDFEILRPIYIAAMISPISLLGNLKVGAGGSARLRVPMYLLAHVSSSSTIIPDGLYMVDMHLPKSICMPCLTSDAIRMGIEKDLWGVIWSMYENRDSVFDAEISVVLEKWRGSGLLPQDPKNKESSQT